MLALIHLILAWLCGVTLIRRAARPLLFPGMADRALASWASWLAGGWVGLLPVTLVTYGLAVLVDALSERIDWLNWYPLWPANIVVMVLMVWLLVTFGWPLIRSRSVDSTGKESSRFDERATHRMMLVVTLSWAVVAALLLWGTFQLKTGLLSAGFSVFSDLAPHTALTRSFAVGRNFPAEYPHFAGDGIAYHFLFFFWCGNLNFLGLPLDFALNGPTWLSWVSLAGLLAILARQVTGHRLAIILSPLLFFLRSSFALPIEIMKCWRELSGNNPGWTWLDRVNSLVINLWQRAEFIGETPRDDWGLWGLNVYLNQRHFLSGLAVLVIVLLLVWPDFCDRPLPVARTSRGSRQVLTGLLLISLPYWHGSVLVSTVLIIGLWVVLRRRTPGWLLVAGLGIGSAMIQSTWFSDQRLLIPVQPHWQWGFIAAETSVTGLLVYLMQVTGLAFPLAIAWTIGRNNSVRLLLIAAGLLTLVTLTVSLTVDITVNHKYLMIALMLLGVLLANGLSELWHSRLIWQRGLMIVLLFMLTITGLYEVRLIQNINRSQLSIPVQSELSDWILTQTEPDAVFLTAPYHFHSFFLTGRKVYDGHAYYAWSAGHDTETRDRFVHDFLSASHGDPALARQQAQAEGIDYLLVDQTLRMQSQWPVNEAFFAAHFPRLAAFPEQDRTIIYDLRSPE